MRSRSIRLSITILLILGIAIAALGFKDIDIDVPGFPRIERDGTGPFGLKLGLDLRGGGHLVYQADTGTRFDVTFADDVTINDLVTTLQGLRFGDDDSEFEGLQVVPLALNRYQIRTDILEDGDPRGAGLNDALTEAHGDITLFQTSIIPEPSLDQMQGVLEHITGRVNRFGTEEPIIQIFGDDRIIVQLPGASGSVTNIGLAEPDPEAPAPEVPVDIFTDLPRVLAEAGYEEFNIEFNDAMNFTVQSNTVNIETQGRALTEIGTQIGQLNRFEVTSGIDDAKALIGQTARLEFKERTCENESCTNFTDADLGLTGDDLSRAISTTEAQATKRIAILMDDRELIAPSALAWIRDGRTQITGNFNRDRARELAIQIEAGSLDAPLMLIQESDVDALLGSESLKNSLIAGLVGLGLVFVFMIIYYRMAGVVAAFALVFYAIIVLAIFKMIPITLELAHIGGFILSIGMAVDANILIFERMKEEVRIGRTLASSMEVGFSRAWPAIRDSNISTMITCVVLLWFGDRLGGGLVTGVAISLFIGVAVSMFTAVVVSRNLLQLTAWIGLGGRIELFTPEPLNRTSRESIQTPAPRGGR